MGVENEEMEDRCQMIFQALSDKTRVKIMQLLKEREMCVSDICRHFDMTQPSISHHLDILKRAGLVESEKRGREIHYRFKSDAIIQCCGTQMKVLGIRLGKC
jgi:DNA-binding transcriptional ArsR family regulator